MGEAQFEGMPLVILEALENDIPVVGTNRDGMKELLPEEWRYSYGNYDEFIEKLLSVLKNKPINQVKDLRTEVNKNMSVNAFQDNFVRAVVGRCQ